jgi:hypothetical protein
MKFRVILFAILFLSEHSFSQFKLGIEGGFNLSGMTHTVDPQFSYLPTKETSNFNTRGKIGLILEYTIWDRLTIQSGAFYSAKGFRKLHWVPTQGWNGESEWSAKINYFEVPFNVYYHIWKGFYCGPGFYIDYATGGKTRGRDLIFGEVKEKKHVDFRGSDKGLLFSLGYGIQEEFFFQLQYYYGLDNIMPVNEMAVHRETYRNHGFSITAGWYFSELIKRKINWLKPGQPKKEEISKQLY